MRVGLVEVRPKKQEYVAKEMAGGLGKRLNLKGSLLGSVLDRYLRSNFHAPPILLAQISGVLRKHHHQIDAYYTRDPKEIPSDTEILVVLSSMVDYRNEVDFIQQVKSLFPSLKVIVVGSFASAMPEIYQNSADLVIMGDAEMALENILLEGFPAQNVIRSPDPRDLNELPMVDWEPFLRIGAYATRPFSRERGVSIQKSRGCTMTCNYCPYAAFYGDAKLFSAEYVLKTIEYYYDRHNIRYFMFRDPNFGEKRPEFRRFMDELIRSQFRISWSCEMRLDTFEDNDLRLMHQAGLRYSITGIESSNDDLLKSNMRRPYKKEDTLRKLALLEELGVMVQSNWIIGFAQETEESVRQTIAYARELNTMFATFHIFTPQPGTDVFKQYTSKFVTPDWEDFGYSRLVWKHDTLSKRFLEDSLRDAYVDYYFRAAYLRKHWKSLARIHAH